MCDCIDELTNKITKHYTEPDKRVESVKLSGISYTTNRTKLNIRRSTSTDVKVAFSQGRPKKSIILHTFCPFCGEQYYPKDEVSNA